MPVGKTALGALNFAGKALSLAVRRGEVIHETTRIRGRRLLRFDGEPCYLQGFQPELAPHPARSRLTLLGDLERRDHQTRIGKGL